MSIEISDVIQVAIDILKEDIELLSKRNKEIQQENKSKCYLYYFNSREALIDTFGESYVKEAILGFEKARNFLKSCGKPKDEFDVLNIWLAKHDGARFSKFASSEYFL